MRKESFMKRKRARSLRQLMDLGLNTPIFIVVTQSNLKGLEHFKKQCAVRFDELACELPEIDALVIPGPPPLIAHSSPCIARELLKALAETGCPFEAQVTDVTIKDSVGAGASIKFNGKMMAEIAIGGSVRDVTRRGKIDARAYLEGNVMKVIGPIGGLLAYCVFESLLALRRMPDGVLEWSCHEGKHGVRGDHVVFWEYHPL